MAGSEASERAVRDQALRRAQTELERLQNRLETLYDDRLDGRIEAAIYDQKAGEIRGQQNEIRKRLHEGQTAALPPARQAVDLLALTSQMAELFVEQPAAEQAKLLRLVVESASWKGGELRMCLREPFSKLRLSNSATPTKDKVLNTVNNKSDIWRRDRDSNPG